YNRSERRSGSGNRQRVRERDFACALGWRRYAVSPAPDAGVSRDQPAALSPGGNGDAWTRAITRTIARGKSPAVTEQLAPAPAATHCGVGREAMPAARADAGGVCDASSPRAPPLQG